MKVENRPLREREFKNKQWKVIFYGNKRIIINGTDIEQMEVFKFLKMEEHAFTIACAVAKGTTSTSVLQILLGMCISAQLSHNCMWLLCDTSSY